VTRDVTAWAWPRIPFRASAVGRGLSISPSLVSDRFFGNLLPGLGPPRSAQQETRVTAALLQTVRRDRFRRDGSPNGVAWRYPDWTAVGFRFRNLRAPKDSHVPAKGFLRLGREPRQLPFAPGPDS
jgi:hypothetical protein